MGWGGGINVFVQVKRWQINDVGDGRDRVGGGGGGLNVLV